MKKVKWQWDWEVFVPLCPYCNELAYEKDHCVFCKKEYKWKNKSKDRQVTVGEYTAVQASNKHINVYKDGRVVMHLSCTKRVSKRRLQGYAVFCEEMKIGPIENELKGKTITIPKYTYKGETMSREKQIEEMVEFLNNRINIERNSYFGKGCMTLPLIEADKILDILKGYRNQSEGEWIVEEHPLVHDKKISCSCCGYSERRGPAWNISWGVHSFCPNCGAKMKGGAE